MKTYKEFKEAAALVLPALKAAPYVIPALGGIVKGVSAITNRETGLSDSEKRRVGELMDIIKRRKTQQTEKDILNYGRKKKKEEEVDEQMVVPRSIKKKNPLMTVETEKEILMQLSNRPAIYHRARTGRKMPPFSEGYKDPMKRELKLKGQQIINDKEKYVKGTTPVRIKKDITFLYPF